MKVFVIFMCYLMMAPFFATPSRANDRPVSPSDTTLARDYLEKASRLIELSEFDSSIYYYKKAAELYKKAALWAPYIDAYSGIGVNYLYLSDYEQAFFYLDTALTESKRHLGEENAYTADGYINMGGYYLEQGYYQQANVHIQQALKIRLNLFGEQHTSVAETYNFVGTLHYNKGHYDSAIVYLQKASAIESHLNGKESPNLSSYYNNIGWFYCEKGDYERALQFLHQSLDIQLKTQQGAQFHTASIYNNLGACYGRKGDPEQELVYLQKALKIETELFGEVHYKVSGTYFNIARSHAAKEQYDQQLFYLEKALSIDRQLFDEHHPVVARNYQEMGHIYGHKGKAEQQLAYYQKSLDICLDLLGKKHPQTARVYFDIGNHYRLQQERRKSLSYFQQALVALVEDFQSADPRVNPASQGASSKVTLFDVLSTKAKVFREIYEKETHTLEDLQFALGTYQLAIGLIDTLRFEPVDKKIKQELTKAALPTYEEAIGVAHQLYQLTHRNEYLHQAFEICEKSKAFLLIQTLNESRAKQFAGVPDPLLQKENSLKTDIAFYRQQLITATHENDTAKIARYQRHLFELNRTFDRLMEQLEKDYPKYYHLKYNTSVATPEAIQTEILEDDEALLEYYLGDSTLFLFTLTKDRLTLTEKSREEDWDEYIRTLRECLTSPTGTADRFIHSAYSLYRVLLEDVNAQIKGKTLIVVSGGLLHYIPFEVLIKEKPGPGQDDYGSLAYLVREHQVSYAYSGTWLWEAAHEKSDRMPQTYIAFAPDFDTRPKEGGEIPSKDRVRNSLNDLPGAKKEVRALRDHLKGVAYFGKDATESKFKQLAGNYDIIHLATHALISDEQPADSRLLFTPGEDPTEDGDLYFWELLNLPLKARMVVLSACNTGYGKLLRGEGIASLAQAFAYAGCPSMMMSLWEVQDQTTAAVMKSFYQNLAKNDRKDVALRKAKLQYLEKADPFDAHPYYWAGFVVMGNVEAIALKNKGPAPLIYAIAGLGLFLLVMLFFSVRKQSLRQLVQ